MAEMELSGLIAAYRSGRISRREFMTRALALGLSMPAIAATLAACAPAREKTPPPPGQASPTPAAQAPTALEPRTGGILREGYDLDFSRLDPINTNWYDPAFFAIYEALITNDPDGNFVPQLAEKWAFSDDGLSVTFTLREGAKFHSGRPLDALAVKEVFDTIQDPESGSPLRILFDPVEGTEAPDSRTIVLKLKHPYFEVLNVVKTGYWRIVNIQKRKELGQEYGQREVDGSGPFLFEEWVPGSHVSVKRWEDYPGSITPYFQNKGKAYLDGIRWIAILEGAQRAVQIENNEIDTLHAPLFQDVPRLQQNPDLNVIVLKEWSGYILNLNFERTDLDFHELKMRQAISHAIDRQAIVKTLLFGQGEPLYGPITSADKYYTPEVEQYNQFDLARAKQLVQELGWAPGSDGILTKNGQRLEFSLVIQAESFNRDLASAIQAQLRDLGMDVKVEALDRGSYFNKLASGADSSIFFYLWPVPIDVVILFVSSKTIPAPNWSRARIPEVDEAVQAWQTAANEDQLRAAGQQFQLAIVKNLPIVPLVNRNNIWVHRKHVHGWLPHQWNLYPYYNDVWLEQ